MAGNIFEETLEILNRWSESVVVKLLVVCSNREFDEHDEYVYSVRKTTNYDYNEKYTVLVPPFRSICFKIALKVPNVEKEYDLAG